MKSDNIAADGETKMKKILCLCVAASLSLAVQAQEPPPETAESAEAEAPVSEQAEPLQAADAAAEPTAEGEAAAVAAESEPEAQAEPESEPESAAAEEIPVDALTEEPTPAPCDTWRCRIAGFFGLGGDAAPAAEDEEAEAEPTRLYVGLDVASVDVSLSNPALTAGFGAAQLDSDFIRARVGWRVFEQLGLELHVGAEGDDGRDAGSAAISGYTGLFLVPSGSVLDTVDVSALIGYASLDVERPGRSAGLSGAAYGVNVELPLRRFGETLPDLRLGTGYMVYAADREARVHGAHLGLRYDFSF